MGERRRFPEGWDPKADGYLAGSEMPDGRWWCLMPLVFGVRIVIVEDQWTNGEHWCYSASDEMATLGVIQWALGWEHPPEGWSRHMHADGTMEYPERIEA